MSVSDAHIDLSRGYSHSIVLETYLDYNCMDEFQRFDSLMIEMHRAKPVLQISCRDHEVDVIFIDAFSMLETTSAVRASLMSGRARMTHYF